MAKDGAAAGGAAIDGAAAIVGGAADGGGLAAEVPALTPLSSDEVAAALGCTSQPCTWVTATPGGPATVTVTWTLQEDRVVAVEIVARTPGFLGHRPGQQLLLDVLDRLPGVPTDMFEASASSTGPRDLPRSSLGVVGVGGHTVVFDLDLWPPDPADPQSGSTVRLWVHTTLPTTRHGQS